MKNITKRIVALALTAILIFAFAAVVSASEPSAPCALVSISDKDGNIVLSWEKVEYYDADSDGKMTINDVLIIAHEKKFEGGADAGYGYAKTEYGLSMTKLWGTENGGSYGYFLNNESALSLDTEISDGAHIYAYVYTDLTSWSDTYSFFDVYNVDAEKGDTVKITLKKAGFDENYNPVTSPVSGASIIIDGKTTEFKTGEDGTVEIKLSSAGNYVISAKSDTENLVPPVVLANVEAGASVIWYIVVAVIVLGVISAAVAVSRTKKNA